MSHSYHDWQRAPSIWNLKNYYSVWQNIQIPCPAHLPPHHLIHSKETKGSGEEGQGTRARERPEFEVDAERVSVVKETIM